MVLKPFEFSKHCLKELVDLLVWHSIGDKESGNMHEVSTEWSDANGALTSEPIAGPCFVTPSNSDDDDDDDDHESNLQRRRRLWKLLSCITGNH